MKLESIFKSVLSEATSERYVVQYVTGGSSNWKVKNILGKFTKEEADAKISELKRAGYYAVKYKEKQFKSIGGLPDSTEFQDDKSRQKYYNDMMKSAGKIQEAGLDTGQRTFGGSYLNRDQTVFSYETVNDAIAKLNSKIDAPFVKSSASTLGGDRNVSILMAVSLDPKSEWPGGIYENSRYMRFHLQQDGVIEQFTVSYKLIRTVKKFRKTRGKSLDDVISKINAYLSKVK